MELKSGHGEFDTKQGYLNHGTGNFSYEFARIGEFVTYIKFDWYYPSEYEGKEMKFIIDADVTCNNMDDYDATNMQIGGKLFTGRSFSDPTLSEPSLSNTEAGKYQMTYSTTTAPIKRWNNIDNKNESNWTTTSDKNGTLLVNIQDNKQEYTFKVIYQLNKYFESKQYTVTKTVKAFHQAINFKAQPAENSGTLLTWEIANKEATCEEGDNFEIQRATNANFDGAESVGTVQFNRNNTDYLILDKCGDLNLNETVYYRIRRTKMAASWDWAVSQKDQIDKKTEHRQVKSATAEWDQENNKATIKWELTPKDNDQYKHVVWSTGAQLVVTRKVDAGKNGGVTTEELIVTEDDLKNGYLTDELNKMCAKYTYTVHVKPGNNNFTTQTPVNAQLKGDPIYPVMAGKIESITASKGYFSNYVQLEWKTDGIAIDEFKIERRLSGTEQWTTVESKEGGAQKSHTYSDDHVLAGYIYEYRVLAVTHCADEDKTEASEIVRGFRSPTGMISGKVTFEYGDAAPGVVIRLSGKDIQSGKSLLFNGVETSYAQTDEKFTPAEAFSILAFVKPTQTGQTAVVVDAGTYLLGVQNGKPAFSANGGSNWVICDNDLPTDGFSQLSAIYATDGSWTVYVDTTQIKIQNPAQRGSLTSKEVTIGKGFKGYVDEVRLWNKSLSRTEINQTFNRLLVGNESSLAAYWRFDDGLEDEFYDISNYASIYNARHGKIHEATISSEIPEQGQLALVGITGTDGVYTITGIPYNGDGSSYTLTPSYPNHTFNPTSTPVTIGSTATALSDINFTDNSAIMIDGFVFYENSTIPVVGATFKINGQTVFDGNSTLITSGSDGKFKFSVPTGRQKVEVIKQNHTFVDGGILYNSDKESYPNYTQPMSDLRFWDNTKVKLIGRVAGGTVEGNKPLGFSLSKNNLGDDAHLTLKLQGGSKADISTEKKDSTQMHHDGKHSNTVSYEKEKITICPDPKTGEFVAWLYPEKYTVDEIYVKGFDNLLGADALPTLSLENCFEEQVSEYTTEEGVTNRYIYNADYNYNYRVNPALTYVQLRSKGGEPLDYFGDAYFTTTTKDGNNQKVVIYDKTTDRYLFDKPIFHEATYVFRVSSHEDYYYNNVTDGEGVVVDLVPTQGGELKITNEMSTYTQGTATLDETGAAEVEIEVNSPDIAGNLADKGVKTLDFAVGGTTAPQLKAYVLGARVAGASFVTAGPITLFNILRDPPGSHSYSYCEAGQTYTYHSSRATGQAHKGSETINGYYGCSTTSGFGVMISNDIINTVGAKAEQEASSSDANGSSVSLTINNRYQTSDDPIYVGADGDLFLGTTSNIIYGPADEITIMAKEEWERMIEAKGDGTLYGDVNEPFIEAGGFVIVRQRALSIGVKHETFFSYPQVYIKNTLIDNIRAVRNSLFAPFGTTKAEAQNLADNTNQPVYITHRKANEEGYGEDNMEDGYLSDGDSYTVVLPTGAFTGTCDSVYVLNQSIREWERLLEMNEREKATATDLINNYSFHVGGMIEHSEQTSSMTEQTHTYNLIAGGGLLTDLGFTVNKCGLVVSIEELGYGTKDTESGSSSEDSKTIGFVLADEGDDDYLTVDVLRAPRPEGSFNETIADNLDKYTGKQFGSFVFKTKGGATSCPYEGELLTEYYAPGTRLNAPTLRIENPKISAEKPVVSNVPSDQAAKFVLNLYNESEAAEGCYFNLSIVDAANQKGAKFSIDGVPLADKRGILVDYGEVLQKTLEIRRDTEYDYEDLAIVLSSQCQADPTGFQEIIADTVYISAHFIPSSSDINIKSPTDKWTLNTNSPKDSTGKYYMPLTIDGFDVNFQGFHHIEVQYKASSEADTRWTNICSFFTDTAYYKEASGTKAFIEGPTITTRFFGAEDQNYDIRAVTFSKAGNEFVTKESPVITGVKDTKRPVVFGNIEPADGVLGVEDEIRLTFNETIAEGYMTEVKNFRVTGTRNGSNGDHSTALTFDGRNSYLETQVTRNLEAKDVTVEMWINPSASGQDMTLFSHGDATNALELTLAKDNTLKVRIGELEYSSKGLNVKLDEWQHVAMTYRAANQQLSVYFGGQAVVAGVQTVPYSGVGPMTFGRSLQGKNYFAGQMHEARVWTKVVEMTDLIANSLRIYTGREAGLLAYYRMNEGKGEMAMDKSQGATAYMYGATWSTQDGKSLSFNGKDAIAVVNSSRVAITGSSDYTLEFWFKAAADQKEDAALVANGKGIGEENNGNTNKVFVGFVDNELLFRNNGYEQKVAGNFRDGAWHHFVLAVNRTAGNAQIFMDGVLNSYFDASNVGGFSATQLYAGARRWTEAEQMVNHTDMHLDGSVSTNCFLQMLKTCWRPSMQADVA